VPHQRNDRIGSLVIRAFVADGTDPKLLIRILDVHPTGPDRVIGTVDSVATAVDLVATWLAALLEPLPADDVAD
jgi:hypothetical protein